jgi:hypothetical protein
VNPKPASQPPSLLAFVRHLGEVTLAMFIGMFALGLSLGLFARAVGSSVGSVRVSHPELFMLGMASAMSVTMIAWMRGRRHSWRQASEMTAAMYVPVLAVLAYYSAGAITADPVCPLSCMLMIPAMGQRCSSASTRTHTDAQRKSAGDGGGSGRTWQRATLHRAARHELATVRRQARQPKRTGADSGAAGVLSPSLPRAA